MTPAELVAATRKVWERGWKPPDEAFHSKEFHQLVNTCARLYPSKQVSQTHNPYQEAVENIFLNTPSRWFGKVEQQPEEAAEIVHQAFTQNEWSVTHLVPLDRCPSFPGVIGLGDWQVGGFNRKQFGNLIGESRLIAHSFREDRDHDVRQKEIQREIARLGEFQWLVVREDRRFDGLVQRLPDNWPYNSDDDSEFPNMPEVPELETVSLLPHLSRNSEHVERALLALTLWRWEDFMEEGIGMDVWRPFATPWTYEVSSDPLARPARLPAANSLSWNIHSYEDPESGDLRETPNPWETKHDLAFIETLERDLGGIWNALQTVWPSNGESHAAFNKLVPHFFLRAFGANGIDQLIFHCIAIDAALGDDAQGATKRTGKRIGTLLKDPSKRSDFKKIYGLRSDYIHGRKMRRDLLYKELRSARQLTRQVVHAWLRHLAGYPNMTRDEVLKALSS